MAGCDQGLTGVVAGGDGVVEAVFAAGAVKRGQLWVAENSWRRGKARETWRSRAAEC